MSAQSSHEFFNHWATYHKAVASDYMFHREIGEKLKRALGARFSGPRFAFLDLGCGDATALAPLLQDATPSRYKGVDLSKTALALAARALEALPCPVTLGHGDILAVLAEDDAYDVIYSSFALHHLPTEQKGEFFRLASRQAACCCLSTQRAKRAKRSMTTCGAIVLGCAANGRASARRRRNLSAITSSITTGPSLFRRCAPRPARPDWRSRLAARIGSSVLRMHRD
jgi:ubiquinone/menaquinone biosynthesis C-methylase UbiE